MTPEELHWWADVSAILTFIIALVGGTIGVGGFLRARYLFCRKSRALESFLRKEKSTGKGQHSINRIIKDVG
jgi:hypothetical protein